MMNKQHRPHGNKLSTLESLVLKIRAFEMVLIIFYMEDLKCFIIESIEATDRFNKVDRLIDNVPGKKKRKKFEMARVLLVKEGVINQEQSEELKNMVDYRNLIAHEVSDLTVDVGPYSHLVIDRKFNFDDDISTFNPVPSYDYTMAKRAKEMRDHIFSGMARKHFIMHASLDILRFEAAEKTYFLEIKKLKKRLNIGIVKYNEFIKNTNEIMKSIPRPVIEEVNSGNPKNRNDNGTLTKEGIEGVFMLYDAGANPYVVSYFMRMSYRSAMRWYNRWEKNKTEREHKN